MTLPLILGGVKDPEVRYALEELARHTPLPDAALTEPFFNVLRLKPFGLTSLKNDNYLGLTGTDNTAAFQALVDFIETTFQSKRNTGATIYFPPGRYRVDGPVTFPNNRAIRVIGAGRGGSRTQNNTNPESITRLRRGSGTAAMLVLETAASSTEFTCLELGGMTLDGGLDFSLTGCSALLQCTGAPELRVRDVKFQSNDGFGVLGDSLENADFSGVRVHNCGSATKDALLSGATGLDRTPAFIISSSGPLGATNTVRLTDMEFEDNNGHDFVAYSESGTNAPNKITAENWKMEGVGDGGDYPYMHLRYVTECKFSNISIVGHRPYTSWLHEGSSAPEPNEACSVTNLSIRQQTGQPDQQIDQSGGNLRVLNGSLSYAAGLDPVTAFWNIQSSVGAGAVRYEGVYDEATALFADAR